MGNKSQRKTNKIKFIAPNLAMFCMVLLTFILGACSVNSKSSASKMTVNHIRVVMDNNYPPYAFLDKAGNLQGILVDQWKLWEKHTGIKVEITGLPWEEALVRMKNGEFDVIDTIFYTEDRAKIFDFTKPYANIDVRIFFPNNVSGFATATDLQGFRVAVKTGDANAEYLLQQGVSNLVYYNSYEEIIQAVSKRKESIFVIDGPPALYFLHKYNIQNDFNYSDPLYGGMFHRAVLKGNTAMLKLVNDGFSEISTNEYNDIDTHWFGSQYPGNLDRIISYLGIGIAATLLVISILIVFNRSLQRRVHERTRDLEDAMSNLQKSEEQFRAAIEFLPIPISIADTNDNVLLVNKKFTEHYGYELSDIPLVSKWLELAYSNPEYKKEVTDQWNTDVINATKNNTATPLREYDITGKDGRLHNAEILMRPVKDLWIASFVEVTEHKTTEKKIQESEKRYRALFEDSPIPLLEEDFSALKTYLNELQESGVKDFADYFKSHPDEAKKCASLVQIVDINQAAMKWYGHQTKQAIHVKLSELMNPSEHQSFIEEVLALIEGGTRYEISISRFARDNTPLHLVISGTVAPGYEDTWERLLISIQDITELKQAETNLAVAYDTTLEGWAKALELKDKETEGHSRRVTKITLTVAKAMGFKERELVDIRRGTILHDIGKMSIPDEILRKNGALSEEEKRVVEKHPRVAYELLKDIPHLKNALEIPYCHHEKWDGSGYPRGLKGEEIPLTARVFAVVDVWDALLSDRPYRSAWDKNKVIEYLLEQSGKHFDPRIVKKFIELVDQGEI